MNGAEDKLTKGHVNHPFSVKMRVDSEGLFDAKFEISGKTTYHTA